MAALKAIAASILWIAIIISIFHFVPAPWWATLIILLLIGGALF